MYAALPELARMYGAAVEGINRWFDMLKAQQKEHGYHAINVYNMAELGFDIIIEERSSEMLIHLDIKKKRQKAVVGK